MSFRAFRSALILSAIVIAGPLTAQVAPAPPLGADVRLDTHDGKHVIGNVVGITPDTVYLRRFARPARGEIPRAIPLTTIRAYSVSAGWDKWRGAQRGAIIGATLGLVLVGYALHVDAAGDKSDVMVPSIVFAVPGAIVLTAGSALIGSLAAPRRWNEPVPLVR
jgi:hypothetical protein